MSDIRKEYELAIQSVKAAFLDTIYREQGLVAILSSKVEGYTEEQKTTLLELFTKQNDNVETVLSTLEGLSVSMEDVIKIGEEIKAITEGKTVNAEAVVENNDVVVAVEASENTDNSVQVETGDVVVPAVVQEGDTAVATEGEQEVTTADVVIEVPTGTPAETPVQEENTQPTEEPVAEVGTTTEVAAVADAAPAQEAQKEEVVPFALSPIDEGVTPAQEAAPAVATDTTNNVLQFKRNTNDPVKAILVTGAQFGKLKGSCETAEALFNSKINTSNAQLNTMLSQPAAEQTADSAKVLQIAA